MSKDKKNKFNEKSSSFQEKNQTEEKIADAMLPEKKISTRGRIFEGKVTKKFPKRIVITMENLVYVRKYERYKRSRTRIHARLPEALEKEMNVGDLVRVQECRPLSKTIHFMAIKKIKGKEELK